VNRKWGLRTSVLTGDFLLARSCFYISNIQKVRLNTIFSQMVMDMCNGEIAQLKRRYRSGLTLEEYLEQVSCKTALLMAIACQGAGIINDVSPEVEQALYQYGHQLGIAFQIMDDMLDFSSSNGELGKSVHNDLVQGQVTLPSYYALQNSPDAPELKSIIERHLEQTGDHERALEIILSSDAMKRSDQKAHDYVDAAIQAIDILPDSDAKQALVDLARYSIQRSQ